MIYWWFSRETYQPTSIMRWDKDGIGVFFPDFTMKHGGFWTWYDMIENSLFLKRQKHGFHHNKLMCW